jgi:myo-inositol-1(or 4)-monophosphatase
LSEELLELACAAARAAGALERERFGDPGRIETKSSAIDLVTEVDRAADALLLEFIRKERPADAVLTEESGAAQAGTSGVRWIIDPLDGTTNFAHGVPHFAVSIGIERDGVREFGVVYDPLRDELFSAQRGRGAFLNGRPLRVSRTERLEGALLATGFAYSIHRGGRLRNLAHFERFMRRAQAVRRPGSAALDLAYVAAGRFDGYWELDLKPWDVAAGLLLVEEAGGRVSDIAGEPAPASGERCVASNGLLHAALLAVLAEDPEPAHG